MRIVRATVLFADLMGFTEAVEALGDVAYLRFMTEFREVAWACISAHAGESEVERGFWGDEIKVVFRGEDPLRNAVSAVSCAIDLHARWATSKVNRERERLGLDPLEFKTGVATADLTVGLFAGAREPESEGVPLCTARTLSKQAKKGGAMRIYVDAATRDLSDGSIAGVSFLPVPGTDTSEIRLEADPSS